MKEIADIYDSNRNKTGKTRLRGAELAKGEYALIVMVLIFDADGKMLIQQRQNHLEWQPGKWTMTAGGLVQAGENSAQAAERELLEELGIKIDFSGKRPNFAMTNNNAFIDYFLVTMNIDLAKISVPTNEVKAAKWAAKSDMLSMIKRGDCPPYRESFVNFCFDMGRGYDLFS